MPLTGPLERSVLQNYIIFDKYQNSGNLIHCVFKHVAGCPVIASAPAASVGYLSFPGVLILFLSFCPEVEVIIAVFFIVLIVIFGIVSTSLAVIASLSGVCRGCVGYYIG